MQLNEVIEDLTKWIQLNLCDIGLMKPSKSNMSNDYSVVKPKAFALYVPLQDQLPPDVDYQIPSICLQLKEGSDNMTDNLRNLDFRLAFSTYRPGHFIEEDDGKVTFIRDAEGWKDLWLWVSKSVNTIQTKMYIEGVRVDRATPVKYGHFQIDDNMVEAYPMWYAWVEFSVTCGIGSKANEYNNYL